MLLTGTALFLSNVTPRICVTRHGEQAWHRNFLEINRTGLSEGTRPHGRVLECCAGTGFYPDIAFPQGLSDAVPHANQLPKFSLRGTKSISPKEISEREIYLKYGQPRNLE